MQSTIAKKAIGSPLQQDAPPPADSSIPRRSVDTSGRQENSKALAHLADNTGSSIDLVLSETPKAVATDHKSKGSDNSKALAHDVLDDSTTDVESGTSTRAGAYRITGTTSDSSREQHGGRRSDDIEAASGLPFVAEATVVTEESHTQQNNYSPQDSTRQPPTSPHGEAIVATRVVSEERPRRKNGKCIFILLAVVAFVAAAIGAGVALLLPDPSPQQTPAENESSSSPPPTAPSVPSASWPPSIAPTTSLIHQSLAPSTTPSIVYPSSSMALSLHPTTATWVQIGNTIDGLDRADQFGETVSISDSGLVLAIGAQYHDNAGNEDTGQVRVFKLDLVNSTWIPVGQQLVGENRPGAWFGDCVALSGSGETVAVLDNMPSVHVYELSAADGSPSNWTLLGEVIMDGFGGDKDSVALSSNGRILAIGSRSNSTARIYQYTEASSSWIQMGQDLVGRLVGDEFGTSVALSEAGTTVLIGSPGTISGVGGGEGGDIGSPLTGYARAYHYSNGTWSVIGFDMQGETIGDQTGWSVSLSKDGTTAAIGGVLNDSGGENAGYVRVLTYNNDNQAWLQVGSDIIGEAPLDNSGFALELSADGKTVAVGAPGNKGRPFDDVESSVNFNAGHTRVYSFSDGAWTQIGTDLDGEFGGDQSGYDISMSSTGKVVAIGAPLSNAAGRRDSGHVRVFFAP